MFGDRVKQVREAHNYSQVQLAAILHVSRQTVSNWENNNIMPSIDKKVQNMFLRVDIKTNNHKKKVKNYF